MEIRTDFSECSSINFDKCVHPCNPHTYQKWGYLCHSRIFILESYQVSLHHAKYLHLHFCSPIVIVSLFLSFFFFLMFYLAFESECVGRGGAEIEGGLRVWSWLCTDRLTAASLRCGARTHKLQDHDPSWVVHSANWATQAPSLFFFIAE